MTREELSELFNKYLDREYNEAEWGVHGHKQYFEFETELKNCEEFRKKCFDKTIKNTKIKIAISSNKNFCNTSLPILIPTLEEAGIKKSTVHVFIGGYEEYKCTENYGYTTHYLDHNSYEYAPLIEICDKNLEAEYWFLLHDTCKVGPNFKKLLYSIPATKPDKIAMKPRPCMSMGLYKYSYLLSVKDKLMAIKNKDYSDKAMNYWKDWGVWNEDYILFNTKPDPMIYPSNSYIEDKGLNNWYNTQTVRKVEYYPSLDVYKNKANWGQTNNKNMVRVL
jgi:hypothetical protein